MKYKLIVIIFIFLIQCSFLFSNDYNFSDIISLTIPADFEVISINQNLSQKYGKDQYCWSISIWFVFNNSILNFECNLFGNKKNINDAKKLIKYSEKDFSEYTNIYNHTVQVENLIEKYKKSPNINNKGIQYSVFRNNWGSGITSDYIGYYFKTKNGTFTECVINLFNSWDAMGVKSLLEDDDEHYKSALQNENQKIKLFYEYLDQIVNSINFNSQDISAQYYKKIISNLNPRDDYVLPIQKGLRIREKPNPNSMIIGEVQDTAYEIIDQGSTEVINGKKGQWVRIVPFLGTSIGWAFDAYLRPLTEEEKIKYLYYD
jgi:hypothetical protein